MNKFLRKIIYCILLIQEKTLTYKLDKSLKYTYKNKTSKTVLSKTEHMTLSTETLKNKEIVRKNVEDITKNCKNNPHKLLEYIKAEGTKVLTINNADKLLGIIGEEEGLICELKGLKALYLNLCTGSGISFYSKPVFIIREGNIEPLYMLHHFYRWYALKMNLPGFDFESQQNLKKYLKNINNPDINTLAVNDILELQEAIARDKEATDFCLSFARQTEGAKNVKQKMSNGGADI